jgi:hypothetical protein
MKARFAVRVASTVAAVMLAWPPTAVRALSTVCTGTSQVFNFTGAVESFTVPPGVIQVTIDAAGAAGGAGSAGDGGKGAELAASFAVTPGETLNILVGGAGGNRDTGGGGGGGSFVYTSATATGLLIAAAGGGGTGGNPGGAGNAGNAAGNGGGVDTFGSGGSGGNGGGGGGFGGGGGGLLSNGGNATALGEGGGAALANGGAGGSGFSGGGFGGGGGGLGGGGGGYNGGGGGGCCGNVGGGGFGGGGGSYSAAPPSFTQGGVQSGNGQVSFCFSTTTTGPTGNMRCYEARRTKDTPKLVPVSVSLQDQFNSASSIVKVQRQLCNPSSVDGAFAPGIDQTAHLTCYDKKDQSLTPKFKHVDVQVTNVFGTQQLTLSKPFRLCVPSEKGIVPAAPTPSSLQIDHYRCYKANFKKGFTFTPPTGVSIADQFESTTADVRPGNRLIFCNPVSKNGAPILDPATHLTCFRLIESPSEPNIDVAVDNQFGAGQRLTVRRQTAATSLCLPSSKTVLASPSGAFLDGEVCQLGASPYQPSARRVDQPAALP